MLGAGARLRRSRPCRRTRCPCSRSGCRRVAVAPSWSRRFDHQHRHGPHVALLSHRCGHVAHVAVAPTLWRSCCSDIAAVTVTLRALRSRRCYGVAVAATIAAAADALLSRRRRVAVASPSRPRGRGAEAPMFGVGPEPWHRHSRLCRCTRVLTRGRAAVAPSLSRCQHALAGDRCAYAPRAVPRCLVGLVGCPWLRGLVDRVVRVVIARRTHQPSAALGFAPLLALSSASSSAS
jgi:hypothetical protein